MKVVNSNNFESEVIDSNIPVLVDFYADWCGPCKMVMPILENIESTTVGQLKIVKVNVEESQDLATTYNVRNIPTMVLFSGDAEEGRLVGTKTKTDMSSFLTKNISTLNI